MVVIIEVVECLTYSNVTEVIDTTLNYMPFFYSLLTRWFNYVKVEEYFTISIKMRDVVRLGYILVNEFRMD